MRVLGIILFSLVCWSCNAPSRFDQLVADQTVFDLAIVNGLVVDGTGAPGYETDLLLDDGTIAFIGKIDLKKISVSKVIDARGKVVSPGFIDVHAHGNPLSDTSFENFLANGTTTILLGQDGYHPSLPDRPYDLLSWMDSLEKAPLALNVALMAGHGSLRRLTEIPDRETPSRQQLDLLTQELERTLQAGAYGLSTGLEYVPGMYAGKSELNALAKTVGEQNAVLASHMRNEDDEAIEASLAELLALGKHCKVHASHLKVVYGQGAERGQEILALLEEARSDGLAVSADVYPYTASYTGIGIVFPAWAKTQRQFEVALNTRKTELEQHLKQRIIKRNGPEATLFGSGPYAGKTLTEAAKEAGMSYVELLLLIGPEGASGAYFIMDEELQEVFITHPGVMIASDGSPTMLHPRGHGTQARIIEEYVVTQKKLTLEQAIYKMAGLPALTMGFEQRGMIKEGFAADLLVFNPDSVKEKATYDNPYQFSTSFDQVLVNGKLVRDKGTLSDSKAGRLLRKR